MIPTIKYSMAELTIDRIIQFDFIRMKANSYKE
jgi:hypothetical protein